MSTRLFTEEFKKKAVALSVSKGSVKTIAEELGIRSELLSKWRNNPLYNGGHLLPDNTKLSEEQLKIRRLEKELREIKLESEILKKSAGHFHKERKDYYEFIKSNEKDYIVRMMCKVLHLSCSAYYRWRKCPNQTMAKLDQQIVEIYNSSHKRYGSPQIKAELNKNGQYVSLKTVAKIMRRRGLKSIVRKRYRVSTTDSSHSYKVSDNLLDRCFHADLPLQKWVSDMTYIPTSEGWLYVTIVMDLFDRKIIGWSFSSDMTASNTAVKALQMAFVNRPPSK